MSAGTRPVHRHLNQQYLDLVGYRQNRAPYLLNNDTNTTDLRTWDLFDGVRNNDGTPADNFNAADYEGVEFSPLRVSQNGTLFVRRLSFNGAGMLVHIGPEVDTGISADSIFATTDGTNVMPISDTKIGARDAFFVRTDKGMRGDTTFMSGAAAPYMKDDDERTGNVMLRDIFGTQEESTDYMPKPAPETLGDGNRYIVKDRTWVRFDIDGLMPVVPSDGVIYVAQNGQWLAMESLSLQSYIHIQTTAADVWPIAHGLGYRWPRVTIVDDQVNEVHTYIDYNQADDNNLVLTFKNPMRGRAILTL